MNSLLLNDSLLNFPSQKSHSILGAKQSWHSVALSGPSRDCPQIRRREIPWLRFTSMHTNLSRANKPTASLAGDAFFGSLVASQGSQPPTIKANSNPSSPPQVWGARRRLEKQAGLRRRPRVTSNLRSRPC